MSTVVEFHPENEPNCGRSLVRSPNPQLSVVMLRQTATASPLSPPPILYSNRPSSIIVLCRSQAVGRLWPGVMQLGGALRRDSGTAVDIAADRTAAKISVLLCKTPCCLVDETGASIWTSSVVTFTAVRFMAVVCKECRCRALFLYRRYDVTAASLLFSLTHFAAYLSCLNE